MVVHLWRHSFQINECVVVATMVAQVAMKKQIIRHYSFCWCGFLRVYIIEICAHLSHTSEQKPIRRSLKWSGIVG